jgi:hypothetical protein
LKGMDSSHIRDLPNSTDGRALGRHRHPTGTIAEQEKWASAQEFQAMPRPAEADLSRCPTCAIVKSDKKVWEEMRCGAASCLGLRA